MRPSPLLLLFLAAACANGGAGLDHGRHSVDDVRDADPPMMTDDAGAAADAGADASACGFVGEACCPGTPCPGGGVCSSGTCEACGGAGELCCPGAVCEGAPECIDGRCGTPAPPTECTPGDPEMRACGRCGTESRTCDGDGSWGAWNACAGEGECTPGESDGLGRCSATCTWEPFVSCSLSACPGGTHIAGLVCDAACGSDCSFGYNALSCERNVGRFTACGNCPAGHRGVAGACEPACHFECSGGVNATVCEPS